MLSPAQRHRMRVLASAAAAAAAEGTLSADATAYEQQLAQLADHRRRLKEIQSIERKAEVKASLLPQYADWVAGVLAGDAGVQDDVLMTVMVWRVDVGDYAGALEIAEYALRHGLTLPDQYRRDTATLLAEEVAESVLRDLHAQREPDVGSLRRVLDLTAPHDMPDEVRAKVFKALGLADRDAAEEREGREAPPEPEAIKLRASALAHLRRALELHAKVGVKKDIERLERLVEADEKHSGPTGA